MSEIVRQKMDVDQATTYIERIKIENRKLE